MEGTPLPQFTDFFFSERGVTDLGGTPLPPFTDFSPEICLQKGLKIVFFAKKKTPDFGPKIGYGFGGYPPAPLYGFFFSKKGFTDKIRKVVFDGLPKLPYEFFSLHNC